MKTRLFDYDPMTGVTEYFEDLGGDEFAIRTVQDCEPIIEMNKAKQSAGRDYYAKDKDMWRVASIPVGVQMKWLIEEGIDVLNQDHWPAVKKKLNSNEWRYLRTAEVII